MGGCTSSAKSGSASNAAIVSTAADRISKAALVRAFPIRNQTAFADVHRGTTTVESRSLSKRS